MYLIGGSIDSMDLTGPKNGNTALVKSTIFYATVTSWATLVAFTPSEFGEFRLWRAGNDAATKTRIQFRFGAHTPFIDQPLAGGGGAMNENQIGCYEYAENAGEDLQFRIFPAALTNGVRGGVKFQRT